MTGAVLVVLTAGLAACAPTVAPDDAGPIVTEVIDGDTIVVGYGRTQETVRLLGLDSPESVDPNRPVQCFGPEASDRLRALVAGGTVRLERDAEARDRYGRLLAYVFVDEVLINELLLAEGFAALAVYEPNVAYRSRLAAAERRARTAVVGLWRACGGPDVPVDPPPPSAQPAAAAHASDHGGPANAGVTRSSQSA